MEEKRTSELLRDIYEQHWLHARHVENERLWFTNIFGVIVAGLLAFLGTVEPTDLPLFAKFAGSFIFILSILGYLLCITWRAPFVDHTILAQKMLIADPLLKRYAPHGKDYEKIKIGGITAHELFLYFYALMASLALFLLLHVGLAWSYWWVSIILFIILCALWRGMDPLRVMIKVLRRGLKVLWRERFRVLRHGLGALWRVVVAVVSWQGLKGREDEYRKKHGVGKW